MLVLTSQAIKILVILPNRTIEGLNFKDNLHISRKFAQVYKSCTIAKNVKQNFFFPTYLATCQCPMSTKPTSRQIVVNVRWKGKASPQKN